MEQVSAVTESMWGPTVMQSFNFINALVKLPPAFPSVAAHLVLQATASGLPFADVTALLHNPDRRSTGDNLAKGMNRVWLRSRLPYVLA